jgi:hypothetical protein
MTKPISHHLTTGTFNYVVKDPNCSRLSGQLWIKDLPGRAGYVSSNLVALVFRLELAEPLRLHSQQIASVGLECFGLNFGWSATRQRVTFCANFPRVSNFDGRVNHFFAVRKKFFSNDASARRSLSPEGAQH